MEILCGFQILEIGEANSIVVEFAFFVGCVFYFRFAWG